MHKAPNLRSRTSQIRGHKIVLAARRSRTWPHFADPRSRMFLMHGVPRLGRTQWYENRFVPAFSDHYPELSELGFMFLCCIALLGGPKI